MHISTILVARNAFLVKKMTQNNVFKFIFDDSMMYFDDTIMCFDDSMM